MPSSTDISVKTAEPAHGGIAELNEEERFISMDEAYLAMLGEQEMNLLGQHWHLSVHADDHQRVEEAYRMARLTGRGFAEIRALRRDSLVVYQALTVTGIHDSSGAFAGYHCLRHDISRYKRDQEALVLAVEAAPNGLLMVDSEWRIQSANRAVETMFGYTSDERIGRPVEILVPARFVTRHLQQRENFKDGREITEKHGRDVVGLRKDGGETPIHSVLNRVKTDSRELIFYTLTDLSERVRYEEQLEHAKQAAEAANRAKSDFLARMSHEIRTPMNLIMGMNSLLLESPLTDNQKRHLQISDRNVRRLLRLINGILDLSKVEAGMFTLAAAPLDIIEVVNECAATMSPAMERKGLEFEAIIDPDIWPHWIGDSERLQQVLLNLIGNSVKFTAHGKVGLRVSGLGKLGLRFELTDTGCGIPPDKVHMIFDQFQQADGAMNRPFEGTGLGLSIARTLVEMMKGKIWVEETGPAGSKFVFTAYLPVAEPDEVLRARAASAPQESGQALQPGTRILIAEDNPENVILLRAYLENLTFSLHFAANGLEALRARQAGRYDLVLMDVQMPVMDGYAATREIRSWELASGTARIPIVALTAHAVSGASAASFASGCDGHLTKPVERADLVATIAKFTKGREKPAAAAPGSIAARRPAFLENRRNDLSKMKSALAGRDFSLIQHIGHDCKGIGAGYGFPEIGRIGANIERAAIALDEVEMEKVISEFERTLNAASPS